MLLLKLEVGGEMTTNDIPEWLMPYTDNDTGPYYSCGKFQSSVAECDLRPKSRLGILSRRHDSKYATCDSLDCLSQADEEYYKNTRSMSTVPRFIGLIPMHGNAPIRYVYKSLGFGYKGAGGKFKQMESADGYWINAKRPVVHKIIPKNLRTQEGDIATQVAVNDGPLSGHTVYAPYEEPAGVCTVFAHSDEPGESALPSGNVRRNTRVYYPKFSSIKKRFKRHRWNQSY
jgi:hypothetical protein